jgi:hypothetical protein
MKNFFGLSVYLTVNAVCRNYKNFFGLSAYLTENAVINKHFFGLSAYLTENAVLIIKLLRPQRVPHRE